MKTRAAVIRQAPGKYEVIDADLEEPRQDEVLVRLVAAGLCHSDDHIATGDLPVATYPMIGGDEGAGVGEAGRPEPRGARPVHPPAFSPPPGFGRGPGAAPSAPNPAAPRATPPPRPRFPHAP